MSDFVTYDGSECQIPPIGPYPEDEPQPPVDDYAEIRIVTGPNGWVRGSDVFVNGKRIPRIVDFALNGSVDGRWEITLTQSVGGGDGLPH